MTYMAFKFRPSLCLNVQRRSFLCKALIPFFRFPGVLFVARKRYLGKEQAGLFLIHFSDSAAHAYHDQAVVGGVYNIFLLLLFYYYYIIIIFFLY